MSVKVTRSPGSHTAGRPSPYGSGSAQVRHQSSGTSRHGTTNTGSFAIDCLAPRETAALSFLLEGFIIFLSEGRRAGRPLRRPFPICYAPGLY